MYKIHLSQDINPYELEELVKVFLKSGEYEFIDYEAQEDQNIQETEEINLHVPCFSTDLSNVEKPEKNIKNQIKRFLYRELQRNTGTAPDWGILTGVRPVKLASEILHREGSEEKAKDILVEDYYLTLEKANLLLDIVSYQ
ncbi:MAG: hypothetical protein AAGU75_15940 [Bacillota bacterium]